MARGIGINRLTTTIVRAFAARRGLGGKKKLFDGAGLFITKTPKGTTVWRLRYRLGRADRIYSIGRYPEISIEAARAERDIARAQIRAGIDPVDARRVRREKATAVADATFKTVAESWFEKHRHEWSDIHFRKSREAFERDVYPSIGRLPVDQVTSPIIARVLEQILARGSHDTATKVHQHLTRVFRLAKVRGMCHENPAVDAREVMPSKPRAAKRAALLDIEALRDVLRQADAAPISPAVRLAQRLCAYTACRIGNVVAATWSDMELDDQAPRWTIPRAQMKVRTRKHDHVVMLGPTITSELRVWKRAAANARHVFPSAVAMTKYPHITREAVEKAYRVTLGLDGRHSLHGWRSSFAALAREAKFARDTVDLALDQMRTASAGPTGDGGERLAECANLMRWWDAELSLAGA